MTPSNDQQLLKKLYECQELILELCNNNLKDEKYIIISSLVSYLENKIMSEMGYIGI